VKNCKTKEHYLQFFKPLKRENSMSDNVKKLTNEQIESFDVDYVQNHVGWDKIESFIEKYFPEKVM
jgi:hypothetical protein